MIWVPSALILCRSDRNFLFLQPFYISFVLSFSEGQKRKGAYTKERCRYKRKGADTKEKGADNKENINIFFLHGIFNFVCLFKV